MTDKLKVYSKPDCKPCNELKQFLTEKGVDFEVFDVSTDMNAREKVMSMGFRSVPQVFSSTGEYIGDGTKVKTLY
jgi:glutaredoxin-like protein NrdH